jgi:hypothetical protein
MMGEHSPKAFLKARRPERYSDSAQVIHQELDRSLLEYHLDSLTTRSQEGAFEHFARKLCEREICPNLLPTTGPTGGGDSKADTETYPVATQLSLVWLVGEAEGAAHERWAFAFSANRKWKPKLESDITKIAKTGRGYSKAFFVTNQAVKASTRAKLEDDLCSKHGLEVRILDRTWILDCVFGNGHQDLAIDILGVTALSSHQQRLGSQDRDNQEDLAALEERIETASRNGNLDPVLVDDALNAADRTRNLEKPAMQIEAAYQRAERLASRCGSQRQRVEVAYQLAYTRYFWLEDFQGFVEQYAVVEKRALGSRNIFDLERLYTLWTCLFSAVHSKLIALNAVTLKEFTATLTKELDRLVDEEDRPSTSLQAKTFLIEMRLLQSRFINEPVGEQLRALTDVIQRSAGLVGYSLRPLIETLTEIGSLFEDDAAYEELFETILSVSVQRDGDLAAAQLLLTRGQKLLQLDRPVQAIANLGRSLTKLYKDESRNALSVALYLTAIAYDAVGLPWAARGTLLAAASIAIDEYWKYDKITIPQYLATQRLKWIELKLGRIPQLLAWHEHSTGQNLGLSSSMRI